MDPSKKGLWLEETNSETTYPRKMQVLQPSPQKLYYYWDVAVIDIPNAFIQTQVEDEGDMAIIKIRGVLVDILVQIAPDVYKPYVTTDKNDKTVTGTVPECPIWYNGCKPTVLSQIHQDSDECRI
jgi:hypothetical protein